MGDDSFCLCRLTFGSFFSIKPPFPTPLFHASSVPVGSSFEGGEPAVQPELVDNGGGGRRIEDLAPLGGDEIFGDNGGVHLHPFGDNLEEIVCLLPRRHNTTRLAGAEDGCFGVVLDEAEDTPCLRELRVETEEGEKEDPPSFRHGVIADGAHYMAFPDARRSDELEIKEFFQLVRLHKLHDVLLGILGLKVTRSRTRASPA